MGQNNRQRRASKARKRSRRSNVAEQPSGTGAPREQWRSDPEPDCGCLTCRVAEDAEVAWREAATVLTSVVAFVWRNGWQPNELVRQVSRAVSRESSELVRLAVLADDAQRPAGPKHPRWESQISHLRTQVSERQIGTTWIATWAESVASSIEVYDATMLELSNLGTIHRLIPPPGETATDVPVAGDQPDDPILAKVRALLAQAESTDFPAEAETFTAKAQSMMSRHAIDEAMLRDALGVADRPITIRLPIDDPYASEKATLLHVVAEAGRCRSISFGPYGLASLTGQASDVRRVELLFTSLLLQAQSALNHEAATGAAGSHRRSRSFRSAFLAGYAQRIGDRLLAERDHAQADAGADVLPVLARQSEAVDAEIERLYGDRLRRQGRRKRDSAGWNAGSDAADRARLRESGVPASADSSRGAIRPG